MKAPRAPAARRVRRLGPRVAARRVRRVRRRAGGLRAAAQGGRRTGGGVRLRRRPRRLGADPAAPAHDRRGPRSRRSRGPALRVRGPPRGQRAVVRRPDQRPQGLRGRQGESEAAARAHNRPTPRRAGCWARSSGGKRSTTRASGGGRTDETRRSYRQYLTWYPAGRYAAEARSMIARCEHETQEAAWQARRSRPARSRATSNTATPTPTGTTPPRRWRGRAAPEGPPAHQQAQQLAAVLVRVRPHAHAPHPRPPVHPENDGPPVRREGAASAASSAAWGGTPRAL